MHFQIVYFSDIPKYLLSLSIAKNQEMQVE